MSDIVELANMSDYPEVKGQLLGNDDGFILRVMIPFDFIVS